MKRKQNHLFSQLTHSWEYVLDEILALERTQKHLVHWFSNLAASQKHLWSLSGHRFPPSHRKLPESESSGRGPKIVIVFKCLRWFWCNLVHSWANILAKRSSSRSMFQALGDKDHTEFCVLSSVKFKTVFDTFKSNNNNKKKWNGELCDYTLQGSNCPLHATYFPPAFGCS